MALASLLRKGERRASRARRARRVRVPPDTQATDSKSPMTCHRLKTHEPG